LPVVIFRLFNTVGPRQTGQYGMVVPRFVEQALQGKPLTVYGDGQQTRCFCNVEDVVHAIIGLAGCPQAAGQVFNIGSTEEVTILGLAEKVLQAVDTLGLQPPSVRSQDERIVFVPYEEAYGAGFEDMRRRVPDVSKIEALIGWQRQLSLEETLRRVALYYTEAEA